MSILEKHGVPFEFLAVESKIRNDVGFDAAMELFELIGSDVRECEPPEPFFWIQLPKNWKDVVPFSWEPIPWAFVKGRKFKNFFDENFKEVDIRYAKYALLRLKEVRCHKASGKMTPGYYGSIHFFVEMESQGEVELLWDFQWYSDTGKLSEEVCLLEFAWNSWTRVR